MTQTIAVDPLLLPISATCPAGRDLRYTSIYEEIMEARRSEDAIALGDWQHDVKRSDWDKVIALCVEALSTDTKDLQIAVWLAEALTAADGFEGLDLGLRVITGLVERFWDCVYPLNNDGDLEYRAAPFEFLNDKVAVHVRQIPLTDRCITPGYSWLRWQESREAGSEADIRNRYDEVDEEKRIRRDQRIAEGAITAEEFDIAVLRSEGAFSGALLESVKRCRETFMELVSVVGEKFGRDAPTLAHLGAAIEACRTLLKKIYPQPEQTDQADQADQADQDQADQPTQSAQSAQSDQSGTPAAPAVQLLARAAPATPAAEVGPRESTLWGEAVIMLDAGQLQDALGMLLFTSNSSASTRDRNRVRLLMAKLCLRAERTDLARPILEDLHGKVEELQLERWESPLWIAEVLDAYYQCLQSDDLSDQDQSLSRALLRRICALDVTKAIPYRI